VTATDQELVLDQMIDAAIADAKANGGEFVPSVLASKLVASAVETSPDALDEWLHARAERLVTSVITKRLQSERHQCQRNAKRSAFRDAAELAASGDFEGMSSFAAVYSVAPDHARRQVRDMTGADHKFVADTYQASGQRELMLAAFHRQVAKVVGKRRTADVMTEQQSHV
jgi:hypothetical protein